MPDNQEYFFTHAVTRKGLALLAKQQVNLVEPEMTRAVAGRGFVDLTELEAQTEVTDPIADMQVGQKQLVDDKVARVGVRLPNSYISAMEFIRQVGIYCKDDDGSEILSQLIQYSTPYPLPSLTLNRNIPLAFETEIDLLFANADVAVVPTSPDWFLTLDDMEAHNNDPDAHANTYLTTVEHNLGILPGAVLYPSDYAYGVGGYGEAPYGGGDFGKGIPIRLQPAGWNAVKVFSTAGYAAFTQASKITDSVYSLSAPDSITTLNLILLR